ncbi:MAG: dimethyl sulfoxide reductase anchor subunit [Nitrospirae bacterium]|nr:dimethyl sulfoxide reductase anchor subunit [Nitrospirota bacterium]
MPQMAFHFNATDCIGCHSCAAACSEKNALPPETAWRKVGAIEGGLWPDTVRVNISMACNHCHTPVCLKGCPTRAYSKDPATGAVIVDSETCIGCKYCTFVCPYNAPVFDPRRGSVSKCNFCVDRQAEGLDPACVAACLGHALTFGPLGEMENGGGETLREIPGFPPAGITRPSIRFAMGNRLPERLERLDQTPLSYHPSTNGTGPKTIAAIAASPSRDRFLGSTVRWKEAEAPLVAFTLLAQAVVGAFLFLLSAVGDQPSARSYSLVAAALVPLLGLGMAASTGHLGKPLRAYRAVRNLRTSWLSREVVAVGALFGGLLAYAGLGLAPEIQAASFKLQGLDAFAAWKGWIGWGVGGVGLAALFTQAMIYVIPARPYWNDRNTPAQFLLSAVTIGPLLAETLAGLSATLGLDPSGWAQPGRARIAWGVSLAGLLVQAAFHADHLRRIDRTRSEAYLSLSGIVGQYRHLTTARVVFWAMGVAILSGGLAGLSAGDGSASAGDAARLVSAAGLAIIAAGEATGRALFFLAVVPMTVPGGAFYRNKLFESATLSRAKEKANGLARS